MNKNAEIAHLNAFVASLPPDSYLAQWMRHAAPFIESDIHNDIFPRITPAAARAECETILARARLDAQKITSAAQQQAAEVVATTPALEPQTA